MNKAEDEKRLESNCKATCNACHNDEIEADTGLNVDCGVFGMYDFDGRDVASSIYYGLFALQHRGQDSCGIAVTDTDAPIEEEVKVRKGMGLANEVFNEGELAKLKGNLGVGHVRYPAEGTSKIENAQPLVVNYIKGTLAIANDGVLMNYNTLKREISQTGAIFQSQVDSEIIGYLIARARAHSSSVEEAVLKACKQLKGGYSMVIMSPRKLIAARDPHGYRPLCIGKRDNAYIVSSETCALETIDAEFVRDIRPGEIVTITPDGIQSNMDLAIDKPASCIFEYVYFARPDSVVDGISVYASRVEAGKVLAERHPVDADIVVGVPDSGTPAGIGYSLGSGIPHGMGFIKNSYVGRTFIKPKQSQRETAVKIKLNVLKETIKGKRVVMVDDSIVRGTTSERIVRMLREAGATEVHVRITSPLFLHPCYYGTDIPSEEKLIGHNKTVEEIRQIIGADSLGFMEVEDLDRIVDGKIHYCDACFTGNYPELPEE